MLLCLSLMLRPTVNQPFCLGIKHPSGAYDQSFITVRQLRVCWCGALSLPRGRVCRWQLPLALASAVIFGSESRGTRDHILLSQIRDFLFVASYDSQGYGGGIRSRLHTGYCNPTSQSQSHITTDGQSVSKSWCRAPSGPHDQIFDSYGLVLRGAPSLTRGWVCLLYMLLALASAVFLRSESLGTRDHIFLSQIWDVPFRRLLRLAGSRWRYSTPPLHGFLILQLTALVI
jgi:hypothetical protein